MLQVSKRHQFRGQLTCCAQLVEPAILCVLGQSNSTEDDVIVDISSSFLLNNPGDRTWHDPQEEEGRSGVAAFC